jgi:hypothetical protein
LGIRQKRDEVADLGRLAERLKSQHPDLVPLIVEARKAVDDYFARGIIPASLIRWEMTGWDDEMKILLSVDGRKPHKR